MKKLLRVLLLLLFITFMPKQARADGFFDIAEFIIGIFSNSPFVELSNKIVTYATLVNVSTSEMMKFGDMLICSGLHGSAADVNIGPISMKLIAPKIFISGIILYSIGFLIMLMTSFYLFDAAFNLAIAVTLLPLALALWPFGWTHDKLSIIVKSIAYYTGLFFFLPLGVLIAKELAFTVVQKTFVESSGFNFMQAYEADQADLIEDELAFYQIPFLKVLLFYIVAIRVIPLLAADFCKYFFDKALVGNPMLDRITDVSQHLLKQSKKIGKFGKDVAKHSAGEKIDQMGKNIGRRRIGGYVGRIISRYGRNMARSRR